MKTFNQQCILFTGFALLVFFSVLGLTLENNAIELFFQDKIASQTMNLLDLAVTPCTLLFGLWMYYLSKGGKTDMVFSVFFPINIILLGFLAWQANNATLFGYAFLTKSFYLLLSSTTILPAVLIWGYANQEYTFKIASIHYPVIAFVFGGLGFILSHTFLILADLSYNYIQIIFLEAAIINLLILAIYFLMNRFDLGVKQLGKASLKSSWFALSIIVFSIAFALDIPKLIFKVQLKDLFADTTTYSEYLGVFANTKIGWGLIGGIFAFASGIWLYIKGPKHFFLVSAMAISAMFITGAIVLKLPFTKENIFLATGASAAIYGLAPVLYYLKDLAFLSIDRAHRLSAKMLTDIIVFSIAIFIKNTVMTSLIAIKGLPNVHMHIYLIIYTLTMILCLFGFYLVHKIIGEGLPAPKHIAKE